MTTNKDHIHIFRSNISTPGDVYAAGLVLNKHPLIQKWTVDTEDNDRVLRIVSAHLDKTKIIELVALCGFTCEELQD